MGLAEGTIRKNGQPAKKPGGPQPGAGRPRRTTCALPGCNLPPGVGRTSARRPYGQFCSIEHESQYQRAYWLWNKYHVTVEQYDAVLAEQGGVCAICGGDDPLAPGRPRADGLAREGSFHVDHDHETNEIRGLLCSLCNRMLGQARDSSRNLLLGAAYLQRFGR